MFRLFALLAACSDPLAEAQSVNTIEAFEAYIATKPGGSSQMIAESNLCQLLVNQARALETLEDYDKAIKKCPRHIEIKKLKGERIKVGFAVAEKTGTTEGWKKFLDENTEAEPKLKSQARDRVAIAEYGDKLATGPVTFKKVNLADDPKGPLNGWGFSATVTNSGDRTISYLSMELRLLDAEGRVKGTKRYPLVAESGPGGLPITEGYEKPLKAGQSREWVYSTDEVPETWAEKAELIAVKVRFEGTPKNQGPAED